MKARIILTRQPLLPCQLLCSRARGCIAPAAPLTALVRFVVPQKLVGTTHRVHVRLEPAVAKQMLMALQAGHGRQSALHAALRVHKHTSTVPSDYSACM